MLMKSLVKRNTYFDSITLMKIARMLTDMPGIEDAAAIMATEPNLQLLADVGMTGMTGVTPPEQSAGPSDILLVVRADTESNADAALQAADKQLFQRPISSSDYAQPGEQRPRSLEQAIRLHPDAQIAIISVPGPYAALEAEQALRNGLHVFLFSDNVPLEDEIALKQLAQEKGLLLMGPDCGTAMLNGAALGFVNVVPSGLIGIVGASGTGIQQVMSLIAQQGSGISQAIGCGGRDLSEAVGAITTLQGLRMLQEDEQTKVIVLISKPPAPTVAARVLEVASSSSKPVIVIFVGADFDALQNRYGNRLVIAQTLAEAAQRAVDICNTSPTQNVVTPLVGVRQPVEKRQTKTTIAALFSGGTLCDEAMHIWTEQLGPIYSNIPLRPEWRLTEGQERQKGHYAIDFGADEYTRGRPHPMIDPNLRLKHLQETAHNPHVGVILLDVVLGYCSLLDPASIYAPAIREALDTAKQEGRELNVVISLCGTEDDPQRLSVQSATLREVGAAVFTSNAEAAFYCLECIS